MGKTGVMINMSLIPTAKFSGSLAYDSTEGIDYNRALELREKYPNTAGTICIGMNNRQIVLLLADINIDYVIPYHKSGMSKATRKLMHMPSWEDYEAYQNETNLSRYDAVKAAKKYGVTILAESDPNYHKAPSFSEWFNLKEAQQIATMENANPTDAAKKEKYGVMYGGYMAMQNAANNYLKLCAERGLSPKFSDPKADFSTEENYWKLLIDRKMVNNSTGEIIEQQTIKPIFEESEILRILNDELERYPKVKEDQEYAIRSVTEKVLSGEIKGGMSAEAIAKVMKKPVDNVTNVNILASAEEDIQFSDRDSTYLDAVKRGDMKTAQKMVDEAAKAAGYTVKAYHGTSAKFNVFKKGEKNGWLGKGIYFTDNRNYAKENGKKILTVYLNPDNLYVSESNDHFGVFSEMIEKFPQMHETNISEVLKSKGYRGVSYTDWDKGAIFSVFSSEQIKSADPVTYDDNGNVIPLSERFNTEDSDIRYSFRGSESGMANDALSAYDEELTRFIEQRGDYIVNSFDKLKQIVNLAFDNPNLKATAYFGIISNESLEKIKNSIPNLAKAIEGILFKEGRDYSIAVTFDSIRHIVDEKGLSREDVIDYLDRLADTILVFDSVAFDYYYQGGQKTPGLLFKKAFSDGTLLSFNLVSQKKRSIVLHSLYLDSVNYQKKKSAKTLLMQNASAYTPKAQVSQTPIKSISQDLESVNSEFSDTDENFSERNNDTISNRTLLANALESTVTNEIEQKKLEQYKQKVATIDAEQAKLNANRAEAQELRFKKGRTPEETQKLKTLDAEATALKNRITIYDKQLLNLESTAALKGVLAREMEKVRKKTEQKGRDALAAYKEKARADQIAIRTQYQESRKKAVESRNKTAVRNKIKSVVAELNTLLLRPTNKKHIKEELRQDVANALSAINMDTVGAENRVALYNERIAKETDPEERAKLIKTRDDIQGQGDRLADKLAQLQLAYDKIKDVKASEDEDLSLAYSSIISDSIKGVTLLVGNTPIRAMTLEQLEMVYDLFTMVRHTIREANKAFNAKKGETISEIARTVNNEVVKLHGQPSERNIVSYLVKKSIWSVLKPYVAFRTIGSNALTDLYRNLRNGEDVYYGDVYDAQQFVQSLYKKYGYKSWNMKATKEFTSKSGKTFDLTLEQMMTLYAYSKREQAHKHIMDGGIVFEESRNGLKVKLTKEAFRISEETLSEISNSLTKEQRGYVDEMQKYLSKDMGDKGNEVSMKLLGVRLFKEEFYLPIKSSKLYMDFKAEQPGEIMLKSPSFSKDVVPNANNPIVLFNFTDIWAQHVNDMSMYHSFALPLEDFSKVYNFGTRKSDTNSEVSFDGEEDRGDVINTKATLETALPGATKYIEKFLRDMNGGVRTETVGFAEKMTSLAKKGAVLGSLSVTIQQPSSILRAMSMVNPYYFRSSLKSVAELRKGWEQLKKYAPIAGIKDMGRFDVDMGPSTIKWIESKSNVLDKVDNFMSAGPALMDRFGWLCIWEAVKTEVAHKNHKKTADSDALLKMAGERFTEVISLTQVYDSVFSRSDIMRNRSWVAKAATAFMAEPMTILNMIWDGWVTARRSGTVGGYAWASIKTLVPVVASMALNSVLKSLVLELRDDDEEDTYLDKFKSDFIDNLNPLSLVPFAKDILSIFKGYDVERMDMSLFSDLANAIKSLDSDKKSEHEKYVNLISAIAALFGIPFKNIAREFKAIYDKIFK